MAINPIPDPRTVESHRGQTSRLCPVESHTFTYVDFVFDWKIYFAKRSFTLRKLFIIIKKSRLKPFFF